MSQQDVLVSLEGSAKVGAKALLTDLLADGHALDLEGAALATTIPAPYGDLLVGLAKPMAKQLIQSLIDKLV